MFSKLMMPNSLQTERDVYISAGRDDSGVADWICDQLERHGVCCWVASRDSDPKLPYGTIDKGPITRARLMITIHSSAGDRRAVAIEERWVASQSALPIVPIEAADIPERIDVDQLVRQIKTLLDFKLPIRVFIYSPEGTENEHQQMLSLFNRIQQNVRERVRLEPVFWRETQVISPSELDIVVFLLWDYAHTRLPWSLTANAWMKVSIATASGLLLYYKVATGFNEQPARKRFKIFGEAMASVNEAIDCWLCKSGSDFLEIGEASVAGNPQPDFNEDFCNYMDEFVKRSLALSQSRSNVWRKKRKITVVGDEESLLIPDRFQKRFVAAYVDSSRPHKSPVVTKATILKEAHFSAFAPTSISPNSEFILEIWACRQSDSEYREVLRRATRRKAISDVGHKDAVPIALGTWLTVSVSVPAFGVSSLEDRMYWNGDIVNTSFVPNVPQDTQEGSYVGTAHITAETVPVATLHFQLTVGTSVKVVSALESQEKVIRSIFASYATEDRAEVLQWARGAEVVGVDVFIDVVSLRAGSNWEVELFRQVPSRDLFSLFWSKPASQSQWVDMEWRCALAARGLDYIHPVALVDPRAVPPPRELMAKHFNDPKRALIEYEKGFQK